MNLLKDIQERMGVVAQFVLDHMNKPVTQLVQAEFNVLYDQYSDAIKEATKNGVSEHDAISVRLKCPVEIPERIYDKFENWFSDRLVAMFKNANNPHNVN